MLRLTDMNFQYELLNLEPRDIKIYEAMLKLPQASSIRTIALANDYNRGTTYEIIKKLMKLGMISTHYKNKRKYYAAEHPRILRQLAEQAQVSITSEIPAINNYIQSLEKLAETQTIGQFTQYYDGEDEIAVLLQDVLSTTAETAERRYSVISSAEVRNHLYKKFRNFTKKRIKAGIWVDVIGVGKLGDTADLASVKLLSSKKAPACYVIIYGHKVATISLSEHGNIQGVLIVNKGVMQLQQLMFDEVWRKLD